MFIGNPLRACAATAGAGQERPERIFVELPNSRLSGPTSRSCAAARNYAVTSSRRSACPAASYTGTLLMASAELYGVPQQRRWRHKCVGVRPSHVRNHLGRDFAANEPNTKWVTDITYIRTAEGRLYLCVVLDLFSKKVVGWSTDTLQDRHPMLRAVLMVLWQREDHSQPVVPHSDHGTQFTCEEYQQFLAGHNSVCSMSAVGHCGDDAAAEGFFGILKRERVNRRHYRSIDEARCCTGRNETSRFTAAKASYLWIKCCRVGRWRRRIPHWKLLCAISV